MKENPGSGSRKNRGLKTKPRAAPLPMHDITCVYYYYFIFASQYDPLASPSRGTDTPHCAGGQWRGTGYPWHANGGYGRSSRTRTYVHATAHTRTYMTSATGTPAR